MSFSLITKELKKCADPIRAKNALWFFKTGRGEYGEGDKFLGITVPNQRKIAKQYKDANLETIQQLLQSTHHEYRMTALLILTYKYAKADEKLKKQIYKFYIKNIQYINNWDLVDVTCPRIVGEYLLYKPEQRKILYTLAKSKNLWKKRIAIISTFTFIRNKEYTDSLKLAQILLHDTHDLIHKAVGWMLREVGNKNLEAEEQFLKRYYKEMPRTMLRYAIEKFPHKKRMYYLNKQSV